MTLAAARHPALSEFLTALRSRLDALSSEGLAAVLVAHAERLPTGSRQAFLDIFPGTTPGRPSVPAVPDGESLLADIAAFADRVAADEFAETDDGFYDCRYDWDDEEPDPAWVSEADALFTAAGEAFVAGQLDLAREAYDRLLTLFGTSGNFGTEMLETWRLETTDVSETLARHLRAVYETTPPQDRATAVHRSYLALPWSPSPPTLNDIAATRQDGLPDLDSFLARWIDHLLAETIRPSPDLRNRLLAEATILHRGVDGLADLARHPGPHQAGIYLAWIDALTTNNCLDQAADAAREALSLQTADTTQRATSADRLADITTRLGHLADAVRARQRAWHTEPTRKRLLALVTTAHAADTLTETLDAEADAACSSDRLTCELLLLAGRVEQAIAALSDADPRGWSSPTHPGPVVLPYLWVAGTATSPPRADQGHLGQAFAAIDLDPDARFVLDRDLDDTSDDDSADDVSADHAPTTNPLLTTLLTRSMLHRPGSPTERIRWLTTAASTVEERVDAVVRNKHRQAYARVASLVVAHAEALTAIGQAAEGHACIAEIGQKYPRHTAFRRELDTAARTSTLLGSHQRRSTPRM